jgi:hypothetical protein
MAVGDIFRRLRGAFGNALVWGVGWFTAAFAVLATPTLGSHYRTGCPDGQRLQLQVHWRLPRYAPPRTAAYGGRRQWPGRYVPL